MSSYITTYTKIHFHPLNPSNDEFKIDDIAHSLSMQCRANGHFREFYSVAQHCLDCYKEASLRNYPKKVCLACLLHDSAEAYITDVPRPIKQHLDKYKEIELNILSLIYKKFLGSDLNEEEQKMVDSVDDTMLYYEFKNFMGEEISDVAPKSAHIPEFRVKPIIEVKNEYLRTLKKALDNTI